MQAIVGMTNRGTLRMALVLILGGSAGIAYRLSSSEPEVAVPSDGKSEEKADARAVSATAPAPMQSHIERTKVSSRPEPALVERPKHSGSTRQLVGRLASLPRMPDDTAGSTVRSRGGVSPRTPRQRKKLAEIVVAHNAKLNETYYDDMMSDHRRRLADLSGPEFRQAMVLAAGVVEAEQEFRLRKGDALARYILSEKNLEKPARHTNQEALGGVFSYGPEDIALWGKDTREVVVNYALKYADSPALVESSRRVSEAKDRFERYVERVRAEKRQKK